jgi:ubiquinone/menaquinone biosynthesis C-methylase UbiE
MTETVDERLANDPTSELWGEHRARYRFAGTFLTPGGRVLDVACGSGFGLEMLASFGARPVGVDYAASALREIKQRLPTARLVCADAARLPLGSASIDLVVSFETIEHVPDACALVRELRRVLKPGGRLVLSTPNRAFGPIERHTANRFHVREFTAAELREMLLDCFKHVELYGQRPSAAYRYVPYLMLEPDRSPSALAWKAMLRLPLGMRDRLVHALNGKPFYPTEEDYAFDLEWTEGVHALVAVAQ